MANAQPGLASPDQGSGLSGMLHPDSKTIQVEFGAEPVDNVKKGYHVIQRWIQFTLDPEGDDKLEYCPDRKFAEFNGGACYDGTDIETCSNTNKTGYIPNKRKCLTNLKKVYIGEEDYKFKNKYFFGTVLDFFTSIQSLYHNKRLEFFRDLVLISNTRAEQEIGTENQGTLSDLSEFREKLAAVLVEGPSPSGGGALGDAQMANKRNLFKLIHRNLVGANSGLYTILITCCTLIRNLYDDQSDIYNICMGDSTKNISSFQPNIIKTMLGYQNPQGGGSLFLGPELNPSQTPDIKTHIDALIDTFKDRYLEYDVNGTKIEQSGSSIIGGLGGIESSPQKLANKICDIIVAACSNKYATDSLEESKREVIEKIALFAENCNEIIHKINFLFSSCKCMPGSNSVYCTPC